MEQTSAKKTYYVLDIDYTITRAEEFRDRGNNKDFVTLLEKEALGKTAKITGEPPAYIRHMRKFGIEWEPMSDTGHMRYGPEGAIIIGLVHEYANQVVREIGVPVYNLLGTNMFRLSEKPVKQHADLFGDRLYQLSVDNEEFILRYAACHQQFAMIKDWTISYKNLPFGAFEIADSYRFEQPGELMLSFRLRRMNMPDLHIFVRDIEEAKRIFLEVHKKIYEIMRTLGRDYVSLYNTTSFEFIQSEKEFLNDLLKIEKKPVLVTVYPPGKDYYWILNIEYHITDVLGRPREIGTVQIDIGNAQRFGIKYIDKHGTENYPVILHIALLGTVERFVYTLFDSALSKGEEKATLPTWISPTQVRLIPIADRHVARANAIADVFEENNIRVDIDDRSQTLQRKVSEAEKRWIPYVIVIGDKEETSDEVIVRSRSTLTSNRKALQEFIIEVKEETKGKPFKPLSYPRSLANRPIFSPS
jgi:threonyl-tRNA synthetase